MRKLTILVFLFVCFWSGQALSQDLTVYSTYDEFKHHLEKNNDTTYVVNFWATWCRPCVAEMPFFEALNEQYRDEKVKVLLVSLDFDNLVESRVKPFLKKKGLQTEVVVLGDIDYNSWISKVSPDWSGAIPGTLIYKGEKRGFFEQQFHSLEEIEEKISEVVGS